MQVKGMLEISAYINDVEIKGVLLTSNTAMRPLYSSWPSLYDTANLSPEASHAIFSIIRLQNGDKICNVLSWSSCKFRELKIEIRIYSEKNVSFFVIRSDEGPEPPDEALVCYILKTVQWE